MSASITNYFGAEIIKTQMLVGMGGLIAFAIAYLKCIYDKYFSLSMVARR